MDIKKLDNAIEAIEEMIVDNAKAKEPVDGEVVSALASLIQARTLVDGMKSLTEELN